MKFFFKLLITSCSFGCIKCTANSTNKFSIEDEDYYVNYDYDTSSNDNYSETFPIRPESLILPNPEGLDTKYTVDILPHIDLPDDSLADTDLRDHDFIDNLMYVYYGANSKNESSYAPEIIIIGSVLSCTAQFLTIFAAFLRKHCNGSRDVNLMFLHLMGCLCLSDLLFMFGIYATKNAVKCRTIAITLHFLHLLTTFWLFFYEYYVYHRSCNAQFPKIQYMIFYTYSLSGALTLISLIISPRGYEIKRFCFLSVQKGMIINFMLPVSALIILSTLYSLCGIRKVNLELSKLEFTASPSTLNGFRNNPEEKKTAGCDTDSEIVSLNECKQCLKLLCVIQTSYDIVWFVAVLALENVHYSNSMSVVYLLTTCLLNWFIFAKAKLFLPTLLNKLTLIDTGVPTVEEDNKGSSSECGSSDSIPLLLNSDCCTEMQEIRAEYISTIST